MGDDPGWGAAWRMLPAMLIPGVAIRRAQQGPGRDGLVILRSLWLSFAFAIVAIGVVVVLLGGPPDGQANEPLGFGILAVVVVLSLVAQAIFSPSLNGTTDPSLGASYRTRFFLRVAGSEAIALAGFTLGIALGPWWLYFVSAAVGLGSLLRIAPTRRHLATDQDALSLAGCTRSLVDVLRSTNVMTIGR